MESEMQLLDRKNVDQTEGCLSARRFLSSTALTRAFSVTAALAFLMGASAAQAQQRIILNQDFVELKNSAGVSIGAFDSQHPVLFCTAGPQTGRLTTSQAGVGSCLRYVNDSRCEAPSQGPADSDICVVGWETTDSEVFNNGVSSGYIAHPIQIGISQGSDLLEGLSVPNGSAELAAESNSRLYQNVCMAANESIPYSFEIGDPLSTNRRRAVNNSQAEIGIYALGSTLGSAAFDSALSPEVSTQTFATATGTLTAPATGGIYQLGFEGVQFRAPSFGNYLRNVQLALPALFDMGGPNTQVTDTTLQEPGATTSIFSINIRVNGRVSAGGIQVPINLAAGSTATPDADFELGTPTGPVGTPTITHVSGTNNWVLNVPAGDYFGGITDALIDIPVSVIGDGSTGENVETFQLELGASSGATVADPICQNDFVTRTGVITIEEPVAQPSLSMTKVADNSGPHTVGDVVTYTYTVVNDGDTIVNDVAVTDTHNGSDPAPIPGNETLLTDVAPLGDSTDATIDNSWDVLAPGDTVVFTGTYTITATDVVNLQ